jgi:4-hydroxybenzoate polyprenyltransferase
VNPRALASTLRPANTRGSLVLLVGGGAVLGAPWTQLGLGAVLVILVYGTATIANDLRDRDIDRANGRATPLATGTVRPRQLVTLAAFCVAGIALLQVWLAQPGGVLFTAGYVTLAAAYSAPGLRVEDRGLAAPALLAACYIVLPLWLAVALAGAHVGALTGVLLGAALLGIAGLLHKDFKDEVGDRRYGKRTPLVRFGQVPVLVLSVILAGAGGVLLLAASERRLATLAALAVAGGALAGMVRRPGGSSWAVQVFSLAVAIGIVAGL